MRDRYTVSAKADWDVGDSFRTAAITSTARLIDALKFLFTIISNIVSNLFHNPSSKNTLRLANPKQKYFIQTTSA